MNLIGNNEEVLFICNANELCFNFIERVFKLCMFQPREHNPRLQVPRVDYILYSLYSAGNVRSHFVACTLLWCSEYALCKRAFLNISLLKPVILHSIMLKKIMSLSLSYMRIEFRLVRSHFIVKLGIDL